MRIQTPAVVGEATDAPSATIGSDPNTQPEDASESVSLRAHDTICDDPCHLAWSAAGGKKILGLDSPPPQATRPLPARPTERPAGDSDSDADDLQSAAKSPCFPNAEESDPHHTTSGPISPAHSPTVPVAPVPVPPAGDAGPSRRRFLSAVGSALGAICVGSASATTTAATPVADAAEKGDCPFPSSDRATANRLRAERDCHLFQPPAIRHRLLCTSTTQADSSYPITE